MVLKRLSLSNSGEDSAYLFRSWGDNAFHHFPGSFDQVSGRQTFKFFSLGDRALSLYDSSSLEKAISL